MAPLSKPIAITAGEPAGIGPDLVIAMAQEKWDVPLVVIADPELLLERAEMLELPLNLLDFDETGDQRAEAGELLVKPVRLASKVQVGVLDSSNAAYVLSTLDAAIKGCQAGVFSAMVTGPVHKGIINDAGCAFTGHTEYLQAKCAVERVVMMLANRTMKVALASTHLPLAEVSASITREVLRQVIQILVDDLKHKFGVETPRILVAGLNPHAGESGHMGREEIDVIEPVMLEFSDSNVYLIGPLPADTLFTPKYLEHADAVLAMYHDQGLPVLKYAGFGESVNITLGLPIIRTSVDHGTALDLAGSGQAEAGSFKAAVAMAEEMINAQVSKSN